MNRIYKGDVEITSENVAQWTKKLKGITRITGDLIIDSNATLPALTSVGGYLSIDSNATLPALTSVGGNLYIHSNATLHALTSVGGDLRIYSNATLEKQLYPNHKNNKWYITEFSSEYIINENPANAVYFLNGTQFNREWFIKIKNDELMPDEVFAIDNIEHRRIAYQYKVLDEAIDNAGNPMRIISFTIQNMKEPLMFYNCYCPSTKREYFLGTAKDTCLEAKSALFGLDNVEFIEEW